MLEKTPVYMEHSSGILAMYKTSWEIYSHLDLGHSGTCSYFNDLTLIILTFCFKISLKQKSYM